MRHTSDWMIQNELVTNHIRALRQHPRYRTVPIVLVPEIGTGHSHTRFRECARAFPRVRTLHQNDGDKPGVRVNAHVKRAYTITMTHALRNHQVAFAHDWFTNTPDAAQQKTKQGVLREFIEELLRFGYDDHGRLTGKGTNRDANDDMAMAGMMAAHWSCEVETARPGHPYSSLLQPHTYEPQRRFR